MAIIATDNFNRANAATLGANWSQRSTRNQPGIFSNAVDVDAGGNLDCARYSGATWPNDQYAQITAVIVAAAVTAVSVRVSTTADTAYSGGDDTNDFGAGRRLWKWVAGVVTEIGSEAIALAASDVIRVEAQGTTIRLKINASQRISVTDSSIASGQAGIELQHSAIDVAVLDNFEGGDFLAATAHGWGYESAGMSSLRVPRSGYARAF